jgi:aspartate aminotransferase-like enzyme
MAPAGRRSDTVTALTLRPEASATTVARTLAADGWTVAVGIEPDQDRLIRIGHMGDLRPEHVDELLARIAPLL